MANFGKFSSENTVIFDDFLPKMTKVRSTYVSWGSNQEWGSIEADMVVLMRLGSKWEFLKRGVTVAFGLTMDFQLPGIF